MHPAPHAAELPAVPQLLGAVHVETGVHVQPGWSMQEVLLTWAAHLSPVPLQSAGSHAQPAVVHSGSCSVSHAGGVPVQGSGAKVHPVARHVSTSWDAHPWLHTAGVWQEPPNVQPPSSQAASVVSELHGWGLPAQKDPAGAQPCWAQGPVAA